MSDHYRRETIANWVADFCHGDDIRMFPAAVVEVAQSVLDTFLVAACAARSVEPAQLSDADAKAALLDHVAKLALPEGVRDFVPALCRRFLEDLQTQGRLGIGNSLGRYVGALKQAFAEASQRAGGKPAPFVRPGAKIGPNEPCPCGSGKKYKKCCGR